MTVVVGTAGHIDHGKTTLLRALTGIDADRLPEERQRGMTIDVGYAHMALADGTSLDFVDVPGHDKLVGNMLVGAGEIDAALLVVAADDGPRAQTLEHLELLDALGIRHGIAVVSKIDSVDTGRAADVARAVAGLLGKTTLACSPVLRVSAVTGEGLDELRASLAELADRALQADHAADDGGRLAIDRVFNVKGRGVAVTGTLRGGALERGMTVRLLPSDRRARIREVQVHGVAVERAVVGRTALNLGGVEATGLHRGMVVTATAGSAAGNPIRSDRALVAIRPTAALGGDRPPLPADRARVRVHIGTEQVGAVVGRTLRDSAEVADGETTAILRFERPVAIMTGDRFVVRRPSPGGTLAGGRVLDAAPPRGISRRRSTPERLADLAGSTTNGTYAAARLALHGAISGPSVGLASDVEGDARADVQAMVRDAGSWLLLADVRAAATSAIRKRVTIGVSDARIAAAALVQRLVDDQLLIRSRDRLAAQGTAPHDVSGTNLAAMAALEAALDVPAPPPLREAARAAGCPVEGIRALEAAGRIVRLDDDLAWSAAAHHHLEVVALELAATAPVTPARLRDATGTSRKYVLAILEDLDRKAVLRRTPDGHVPGPRALARSQP
jgi:selenocysteine-specific elongation factor